MVTAPVLDDPKIQELIDSLIDDEMLLKKELRIADAKISDIKQKLTKKNLQYKELEKLQQSLLDVYKRYMTLHGLAKQNAKTLYQDLEVLKLKSHLASQKDF